MGSTAAKLFVLAVLAVAAASVSAPVARADSIYLKNGRVIHSADVRIEGDRVIFLQFGGYQAIPLAAVDRVEDNDRGEGGAPAAPAPPAAATPDDAGAGDRGPAPADSSAALQALAGMVSGSSGGVDAAQAMQLLQLLGTQQQAGAAGGGDALAPLLGMLGGAGGAAGGPGSTAADLDKIQVVLPALSRLAGALFAPEYSAAETEAAARELIGNLQRIGVSPAEIRARARALGVPDDILERLRDDE